MTIVKDEPCPRCRAKGRDKTGNHLMQFPDGNKHCSRCGYTEINSSKKKQEEELMTDAYTKLTVEQIDQLPAFGIPHKGITAETCEFYNVRTEFSGEGEPFRVWYSHTNEGRLDGFKGKTIKPKSYSASGSITGGDLFGQSKIKQGGKFLVITEGEDDALALWQCLHDRSDLPGWVPPVVSVSHGAKGAAGDIANNIEYVSSFDRIVLVFDEDEAGKQGVDAVCPLLAGKVWIAKLALKDANEMLLKGRGDELKWDIMKHPRKYQPDRIINGADTWERYKHSMAVDCIPYPDEWTELNRMTYGFRPGSIVTITSGTGVGKTQFMRELKLHVWEHTDWHIADISLEEDVGDSVAGLMSLRVGQRLHLPDVSIEEKHELAVHTELFESGRFSFYDHFGGMDDSNLFNKLRYFGATGHRAIFLDHLSIIISEYAAEGNERERIDTVMTKLAKIAKELEIVIFIVVHLRKETAGRSFEQGIVPSMDDLRGSATLKQLSWDIIALSRNQQHFDMYCRHVSKITVLKCRFSGRTGDADYLLFEETSGRMVKVGKPANYDDIPTEGKMR